MRKIIQISSSEIDRDTTIFALCEDGTVWEAYKEVGHGYSWDKLPPIPQDKKEASK